jgi:undecaprenyl-diphosphatase
MERFFQWVQANDLGALYSFERLHEPHLNRFMTHVTHLGDREVAGLVTVAAFVLFVAARRWVPGVILLLAVGLALALAEGGKKLVNRPRPEVSWRLVERETTSSFPSGHALFSMALYGTLAFLCARRAASRGLRVAVVAEAIGLALLIGLSRCYVGVHHPLDVLGGWIAGLSCALMAAWADARWGVSAGAAMPAAPLPPAAPGPVPTPARPPGSGFRAGV